MYRNHILLSRRRAGKLPKKPSKNGPPNYPKSSQKRTEQPYKQALHKKRPPAAAILPILSILAPILASPGRRGGRVKSSFWLPWRLLHPTLRLLHPTLRPGGPPNPPRLVPRPPPGSVLTPFFRPLTDNFGTIWGLGTAVGAIGQLSSIAENTYKPPPEQPTMSMSTLLRVRDAGSQCTQANHRRSKPWHDGRECPNGELDTFRVRTGN